MPAQKVFLLKSGGKRAQVRWLYGIRSERKQLAIFRELAPCSACLDNGGAGGEPLARQARRDAGIRSRLCIGVAPVLGSSWRGGWPAGCA